MEFTDEDLAEWYWVRQLIAENPDATDISLMGGKVVLDMADGRIEQVEICAPPKFSASVLQKHGIDNSFSLEGHRIRAHVSRLGSDGEAEFDIRILPKEPRNFENLGVEPDLRALANRTWGLILIVGDAGTGKTTLANAFLDAINRTRAEKITTVEDPVEYLHTPIKSFFRYKEITHSLSWKEALRDLYREKARVNFVGETRDWDATDIVIDLSLSGRYVLTTLHAKSVEDAVRQILQRAPSEKRETVAENLSECLTAIIAQRVVGPPGKRIYQREYMVLEQSDRALIRDLTRNRNIGQSLSELSRQKKPGYRTFPEGGDDDRR